MNIATLPPDRYIDQIIHIGIRSNSVF